MLECRPRWGPRQACMAPSGSSDSLCCLRVWPRCLLVEAVNSTATKTVPPGTCTLSWTPTEGSTDFLVMFGPAVTFFGGKWIPNDAALVTAAVALGQPGGTAQCLEFTGFGPGKGWQQGAYSEEHGECTWQGAQLAGRHSMGGLCLAGSGQEEGSSVQLPRQRRCRRLLTSSAAFCAG